MIRIAICDDDRNELNDTKELLEDILYEEKLNHKLCSYLSPNELLICNEKFDIVILDIVMEKINGIDVGCILKKKYPDVILIYTTSYEQFIMQAINSVHAFAYLQKPIGKEKLRHQIIESIAKLPDALLELDFQEVVDSKMQEYVKLKININEILYFEYVKRKRKVAIVLQDERYVYDKTFDEVARNFLEYDFEVTRRGILVNLRNVKAIKGYEVILNNDMRLSISQRRVAQFKKHFNEFLQKKL